MRTRRASSGSSVISTRWLRAKPPTIRLIVGGFTCSAAASSPRVFGPPKTSTDSAERRAGPSPVRTSCLRTRRSRWRAAECSRSAITSTSGFIGDSGNRSSNRHILRLTAAGQDMNTATTGVGIARIGQIAINAQDVDRACAFYQDTLGLKLLFKAAPGLAFFDGGGGTLMR